MNCNNYWKLLAGFLLQLSLVQCHEYSVGTVEDSSPLIAIRTIDFPKGRIECRGSKISSLSAINCDSPANCAAVESCLDNLMTNCEGKSRPVVGYPCTENEKLIPNYPPGSEIYYPHGIVPNISNCFTLTVPFSSGMVKCKGFEHDHHEHDHGQGQGQGQLNQLTMTQHFYIGLDFKYHLTSEHIEDSSLIELSVGQRTHSGEHHIFKTRDGDLITVKELKTENHGDNHVLFTKEDLSVGCKAPKFLFNDIRISHTNDQIKTFDYHEHELETIDSSQFLWMMVKNFTLHSNMREISCTARWFNSTKWTETKYTFSIRDSNLMPPSIDKSRNMISLKLGDDQVKIGCNFTNGPGTVKWYQDGNLVSGEPWNATFGEIRQSFLFIPTVTKNTFGKYICMVSNEFGMDKFEFSVNDNTTSNVTKIKMDWLCIIVSIIFTFTFVK